jgi:hypothetical protein
LELKLRVRDPGRWFGALFLAAWLCIWAIGESFALWILIRGAIALVTGTPPDAGREPLQAGPAVMVGAFLLLWVAIWTLGGIAAFAELLRLLFGEDRLVVSGGRLTVTWSRGPFRRSRSFERDAIERVLLLPPRDHLTLQVGGRRVTLSGLGTREERSQAATTLVSELGIASAHVLAGAPRLPERWESIVTPEGERALVPNVGTRRTQARVASVLALGAGAVCFVIVRDVPRNPGLIVGAVLELAFTIALAALTMWLARGRMEWRIGSGRLTLRKRWGSTVSDQFEARRLMIDSTSDSDGDVWYELYALGEGADASVPAATAWRPMRPKNSRMIARMMNEPADMDDLAKWLARESGLDLIDRTTADARAADLAELRAKLEGSGRFGRWVVRHLPKNPQ